MTLEVSSGKPVEIMYSVIESGGKQYRVQLGDVITVEKLAGELGTSLKFDHVLFYSKGDLENPEIILGKPYIQDASVQAEVVGQGRGDKILIIKMKRRKQYRRTQGHRQEYTQIMITQIDHGAGAPATLTDDEKKTKLSQFYTQLKPKGEAFTPKTLGSRKRLAVIKAKSHSSVVNESSPVLAKTEQ